MAIDSGNLQVMDAGVKEMQDVTQRIRHSKYPVVSGGTRPTPFYWFSPPDEDQEWINVNIKESIDL